MSVVVLSLLLVGGHAEVPAAGWRDLRWGATESEVFLRYPDAKKTVSTAPPIKVVRRDGKQEDVASRRATFTGGVASYPAEITFTFSGGGLSAVALFIKPERDALIACRDLASLLEKKYGRDTEYCPTGTTDYIHASKDTMIRLECEQAEVSLTYARWSEPAASAAKVLDADLARMRDL